MIFKLFWGEVNISLTMHDLNIKLYRSIVNIAVKGTMSQLFYLGPGSFLIKYLKVCPFFDIK